MNKDLNVNDDSKYYIPEWNDLHLGDKIQVWHSYDRPIWEDDIFQGWEIEPLKNYITDKAMRVKYLDKEDIESLGWIYYGNTESFKNHNDTCELLFKRDNNYYRLFWMKDKNELKIIEILENAKLETLFYGTCKSINELKTIMKLLNINYE